jgi:hypothetical protein
MRRRLTALSHSWDRLGRIAGDETVGQFAHHLGALGSTHAGPASDLVDRSAATEAQADTGIDGTNFDTRCLDHRRDHKHRRLEGNCAIVAMLQVLRCRHGTAACG